MSSEKKLTHRRKKVSIPENTYDNIRINAKACNNQCAV